MASSIFPKPSAPSSLTASSSGVFREPFSHLGLQILGQTHEVFPPIAVGGNLGVDVEGLQIAGIEAPVEPVNLGASVVDVVLPLHVVAGGLEDVGPGRFR